LVASPIAIDRFSTADLPPETRYDAWLQRSWPRAEPIYQTWPTEPFDVRMESAVLDQLLFVRTEITAMTWERRAGDIRGSDFQPIIVTMMLEGQAQGTLDGRPFLEPAGSYHFHDLARPSRHDSTASVTYSLVLPRDVAKAWFTPVEDLHGLVVTGPMAGAVLDMARSTWALLQTIDTQHASRFERALLELLAAGFEATRPMAPPRTSAEESLRARAIETIDLGVGLGRASAANLSRSLGVSVDQLSSAFRADGGLAAYLLTRRLNAARDALMELDRAEPIGGMAHRLGFSDPAHLSRAFRKKFGVSPREYRRLESRAD
jgi:AraC-like DNA-binding protein